MRSFSAFLVFSVLLACVARPAVAQKPLPTAPPKVASTDRIKTVTYEDTTLNLVPPPEHAFNNDPDLMRVAKAGMAANQVFALAVPPAAYAAARRGSTKAVSSALISVQDSLKGYDISAAMFAQYRKAIRDSWADALTSSASQAMKAADKRVNGALGAGSGTRIDMSQGKITNLGVVAEGDLFLTMGIILKNGATRSKGVTEKSDYANLTAFVLVKNKVITLSLNAPVESLSTIPHAKVLMAAWVRDLLARNASPSEPVAPEPVTPEAEPDTDSVITDKTVTYEGVDFHLAAPPGRTFTGNADIVHVVKLAQPDTRVFAVAVRPDDVVAAMRGDTRDFSFAAFSVYDVLKGADTSADRFVAYKKAMRDHWAEVIASDTNKGDMKAYQEKVNRELSATYGAQLDESKAKITDLGVVAEGDAYITTGLLHRNQYVRVGNVPRLSEWVHLISTVYVKGKILNVYLATPFKSPESLVEAKAEMAKWLTDFLAKNPSPAAPVSPAAP